MNLRQKEKLFKPKDLATKFAMWFVVNWEWHDDTEKGTLLYDVNFSGYSEIPTNHF